MSFEDHLVELGFSLVQQDRSGSRRFALRAHPFLQWWVVVHVDGTAELQWEHELGAYLKAKGFHVSVQDELSLLLFPTGEARGPADASWLDAEIEAAQIRLRSVDLISGT